MSVPPPPKLRTVASIPERRATPCVHLGAETGERVRCGTCGNPNTTKPLHLCRVHGRCTTETPAHERDKYGWCLGCPDYRKPSPKRHAAVHLYPVKGAWERAIEPLLARVDAFDGVIALAVGWDRTRSKRTLDTLDTVCGVIKDRVGDRIRVVEYQNEPSLRETASWSPLWAEVLPEASDTDFVFWGHGKAVTRQWDAGNYCHPWASLLWHVSLDYPDLVEADLKRFPITGAFRKAGRSFGKDSGNWHYSGAFFWQRAGECRARIARYPVERKWTGTESWPGWAYTMSEAGCLFLPGHARTLDLYSPSYWANAVLPSWREWRKVHQPVRLWDWDGVHPELADKLRSMCHDTIRRPVPALGLASVPGNARA